ncbi:ENDOV [Symbiodinium sp. CCMP2456]|nr:ENDOV [Symbiodinium sp. CCMP2456]
MAECIPCDLGTFANISGSTACHICGDDDLWTTSRPLLREQVEKWVEVAGATSQAMCNCREGSHLHEGRCEMCSLGTRCPGSGSLELLPGYASLVNEPGQVFKCYGNSLRCPGGPPGTCAKGRDAGSLACGSCQHRLRATGSGECSSCASGDYALLLTGGLVLFGGTGGFHAVLNAGRDGKQDGRLLVASLSLSQLVTCAQVLSVIHQLDIEWGEPFTWFLQALDILSLDVLLSTLSYFDCVAELTPTLQFSMETLGVPLLAALGPLLIHIYRKMRKRRRHARTYMLWRTLGVLGILFFITFCSSLLEPFRCNEHPSGARTVRTYHNVHCDFVGMHLHLCLLGGVVFLLPLSFLVLCAWILWMELPRRLHRGDMKFIRSCSFLFMRFRPGCEHFCAIFLFRNVLIVISPLLPSMSGGLVFLNLLLYCSFFLVAFGRPWRMLHSTYLDLFIHVGLLLVLDMGTLFTPPVDNRIAMVICSVTTSCMVLAAIVLAAAAVWQHFLVQRKPFYFFLCHHKKAAGSFARLLKIELLRRSSSFTSFIDVDDLSDLSKLFSYVSHDVEKLVLFGTPDVLKRTWCVGELVVARLHKVPTILLKLPNFSQPDEGFLLAYDSLVPDLGDFSSYGFGMKEVKDTLRWLGSVETISLPSYLSKQVLQHVVSSLTMTRAALPSSEQTFDNGCLVLADPENMDATATAYILAELTAREMMHTSVPVVLSAEDRVGPTKVDVLHLILVCTGGCLESSKIAEWLLQARFISTCFISPVISDDSFELPSKMSYQNLARHPYADTLDLGAYVRVLQAVFLEIALPFSPQSCSEAELRLRAKQISARLHPGAAVRNLSSRLVMLASNEELIEVSLALAADASSADSGSLGANISDADELELQRMVSSRFSDFTASCDAMPVESDTVEVAF